MNTTYVYPARAASTFCRCSRGCRYMLTIEVPRHRCMTWHELRVQQTTAKSLPGQQRTGNTSNQTDMTSCLTLRPAKHRFNSCACRWLHALHVMHLHAILSQQCAESAFPMTATPAACIHPGVPKTHNLVNCNAMPRALLDWQTGEIIQS